ncbi:hypothetical protein GGH96_004307 [Coemansia sp. RSA 1972]|nr:hypothetical protein GGH96_004307 [Coemansia sp. RSA 1972]
MEKIFKVVLVGARGCGKTSLRNYFLYRNFTWQCAPTTNPDFVSTSVTLGASDVAMQIWDTGGDPIVTSSLAHDADGIVLVFDSMQSRRALDAQLSKHSVPIVLVRAKSDQPSHGEWTVDNVVCLEACARTGNGVDHVFHKIAELCLDQWHAETQSMVKRASRHGDPIPYHRFEFDETSNSKHCTHRLRATMRRLFCLA